jgi:hypothetical protein
MRKTTSKAQLKIAQKLKIKIATDSFLVAAAQISSALSLVITGEKARPASDHQVSYASSLGLDVTKDSLEVASARIQERLNDRNAELIAEMKLTPGSRVFWKSWKREMIVSSIAENGRLWFKGGNGLGAFPHQVTKV